MARLDKPTEAELFALARLGMDANLNLAVRWLMATMKDARQKSRPRRKRKIEARLKDTNIRFELDRALVEEAESG